MTLTPFRAVLGLGVLAAAGLTSAAPAASPQPKDPVWLTEPFDKGDGCFTSRALPGGMIVGFHYKLDGGQFRLTLANEAWDDKLPEEGKAPATVIVHTPGGKRTLAPRIALAIHTGNTEALAAIWFGGEGDTARNAFAKGTRFEASYDGKALGSFPLDGADAALDALLDCASALEDG